MGRFCYVKIYGQNTNYGIISLVEYNKALLGEIYLKTEISAYGKVNLALDVLYKREDGYHEIKTIMQQIDLSDKLMISERRGGVSISCDNRLVPLDRTNLAYRAWEEISKLTGTKTGLEIRIEKRIPVAAGLAGGSTNGAALIKALNEMWDLGLTVQEMMDIGLKIGADLPFCIMGGTALAEGIGERLTPLKPLVGVPMLVANPGIQISTPYAYSRLKLTDKRIDIDMITTCIEKGELKCIANSLSNVMEDVIITENPVIGQIKDFMISNGALGALMSGSGASVFGIFEDHEKLHFIYKKIKDQVPFVFETRTI